MTLITVFLAVFVVGPMVFLTMTKGAATPARARFLSSLAFVCAVLALGLRYGLPVRWGEDWTVTLLGMGLIWLGWIAVLAFGALALRRSDQGAFMRRLTAVTGVAGTTAPWFGLIWASQITA